MIHDELNARRHFEAVIASIARMYGVDSIEVREAVKEALIDQKRMQLSTTELTEEELKSIAHQLTIYVIREDETLPTLKYSLEQFLEKLPIILTLPHENL